MTGRPMIGKWLGRLAILLQFGVSSLPVVDGALFHDARRQQAVHIEAAGAGCHAGDCVLGQTIQSWSPAQTGAEAPSPISEATDAAAPPCTQPVARRATGIPLGPRAPPVRS